MPDGATGPGTAPALGPASRWRVGGVGRKGAPGRAAPLRRSWAARASRWWVFQELLARWRHPYWQRREVERPATDLVDTIGRLGKPEKTSQLRAFRNVSEAWVVKLLRRERAQRILDVGCGAGETLRRLENLGFRVDGVTINPEEVRLARHPRIHLVDIQGDLGATPLAGARFDAILCFDCLEHLVSPLEGLLTMNRLLEPEGLLLVYLPPAGWTECEYHVLIPDPRQLRWLFNLAGFDLEQRRGRHRFSGRGVRYLGRKKRSGGLVYPGVLH
jgi:SAM-dependent methyltransferase